MQYTILRFGFQHGGLRKEVRELSVSEFSEYCSKQVSPCYIFSTNNQRPGYCDSASMVLRFDSVVTSLKPNRVCFLGQSGNLAFNGVTDVEIDDETPSIGKFFKINCRCGATKNSYFVLQD